MAHQAWEAGSLRVAVVDASAAADLAQSVAGRAMSGDERSELDELRARAIDLEDVLREQDVLRALQLADSMIRAASPQ
jgi:hypothetical protein